MIIVNNITTYPLLTILTNKERLIDKHGTETIVYQAAMYKATPRQHATNYKNHSLLNSTFTRLDRYIATIYA